MGKIIALAGQIASGKTTLARYLEKHDFERVLTYTTRPIREDEKDGVDYHFISEEDFIKKTERQFFAEYTHYNAEFGHCYYGTAKESLQSNNDKNKVIVLNPSGIITLKKSGYDIFTVYLDLDQAVLMRRALNRGDSPVEIGRRIADDTHPFTVLETGDFVDLHIKNSELLPDQIAEWIQNIL